MAAFITATPLLSHPSRINRPQTLRPSVVLPSILPKRRRARMPVCTVHPDAQPPADVPPRITPLSILLILSTTLWSLLLLPISLLLTLVRQPLARSHVTLLALRDALRTAGIRVTVRHRENLPDVPCLIVSNHQSPLDIFALACLNKPLVSLLPARVARVPGLGWLVRLADWVLVRGTDRRSQMDALAKVGERLKSESVAVFPEGAPSESGVMGRFASPVFKAARKAGAPVVPVTVSGTGGMCERGLPVRWGKIDVDVHPQMDMEGMSDKEAADEAARVVRSALPAEMQGSS